MEKKQNQVFRRSYLPMVIFVCSYVIAFGLAFQIYMSWVKQNMTIGLPEVDSITVDQLHLQILSDVQQIKIFLIFWGAVFFTFACFALLNWFLTSPLTRRYR